jgi:hypothetical protein
VSDPYLAGAKPSGNWLSWIFSVPTEDLYFYWAAAVLADRQYVPYFEMQRRLGFLDERIYLERHPEQKTWPLAQRLSYMNREGKHILLSDPWTFARMHLKGTVRVIFDPGATELLKLLELYPKEGGAGLMVQLVDSGPLRTIAAAMTQRLFFGATFCSYPWSWRTCSAHPWCCFPGG